MESMGESTRDGLGGHDGAMRYREQQRLAKGRCLLTEVTWPVVRDAVERGAGIIVPVGACEQHGYHMPLSTDTILVTELAVAVADRLGYLVAPPSNYGFRSRPLSGGGPTYPGTISLSATALIAQVADILDELVRHGFKRIVLLSMHLENQNMLWEAAWQTMRGREHEGLRIMVVEQGFASISERAIEILFGDEFPGWEVEHAAVMETSLMLFLRPDLVHMDQAVDDAAERKTTYEVLPVPADMITASGGLWKATRGTGEKGEAVWAELVDYLEGAVRMEMA
ncbi:MAG: creatininase [Candidatus Taylorbacteria bacterium]